MNPNYDLKLEMLKNEKVKECLTDILDRLHYPLSFEEILEKGHPLEKYLLFKIQGTLGAGFDCDKSAPVKDFFQEKYGYTGDAFDTLMSMQYAWGSTLRNLWKEDRAQIYFSPDSKDYLTLHEKYRFSYSNGKKVYRIDRAQKFIYELAHLSEIFAVLGEKLTEKFGELAVYYHTIGNMSPCPTGRYNPEKGSYYNRCYDRLDLFILTKKFQENSEWADWFAQNAERYHLTAFMQPTLPLVPILKNENVEAYKDELVQYIDTFVSLIQDRSALL